jgi:hypothetical protein
MKIDKHVPVPVTRVKIDWPFAKLKVGESFLIDGIKVPLATLHAAKQIYRRHHGEQEFTVRRTEKGYRCWRVK